ncbi:MAG TPA: tetratricopeptide repeat protein [Gemmatimonadales bacterium]|nr:tetratricopeptide repeat protein [Gemmatimonadales bacterium]
MTVCLLMIALQGQTPSLQAIAKDVATAERTELREPGSDLTFLHLVFLDSARLAAARSDVEAYLRTRPDDPQAQVLLARIGRFQLKRWAECPSLQPCVLGEFNDAPFHAALERALALRSDDATAHYWKARLLADGRPVLRNNEFDVEVDTAQVLMHARRAVALDPRTVRYREFLAVTLANLGRYGDAADAIKPVEGGTHILSLMFQDLDAVPVVEGALPWPGQGAFAAVGLDENPPRFAELAGRSWLTTLSVEQVEAFYRRHWPEFRFFKVDGDSSRLAGLQYLRRGRDGVLQPTRDSSDFAQLEHATEFAGLILGVSRLSPNSERGARYPTAMLGEDRCSEIIIVTGRRAKRT